MIVEIKKSEIFNNFYEMYVDGKICRIVDENGEEMPDAYQTLLKIFPNGLENSDLENFNVSFFPDDLGGWKYPNKDDLNELEDFIKK